MARVSGTGHRQCIFLLLVISHFSVVASTKTALHVAVILSSSELGRPDISDLNSWKQGDTLLSAAQLAANDVNNHSDVLDDYVIHLIPILVPDSDPNHGLVELVKELLSESRNIIGVTGVFDNKLANLILPLAGRMEVDLIQLVDPTALNLDSNMLYPNQTFSLYPSLAVHVRAASFLFQKLRWTKVGLIYSSTDYDPLYLRAAESFVAFIKLIDIDISVELLDVSLNATTNSTLDMLQASGVFAFLVLLPQQESSKLICSAQHRGVEWAWILVATNQLATDNKNESFGFDCLLTNSKSVLNLTQFIVIIQQPPCRPNNTFAVELPADINVRTNNFSEGLRNNPYSSVLYDSVWAISLSLNASVETFNESNHLLRGQVLGRNSSFVKVLKKLKFPSIIGNTTLQLCEYFEIENSMLEIFQFHSGNSILRKVGDFNSMNNTLSLNVTVSINGLGPTTLRTYETFPATLTISLLLVVVALLILTTIILLISVCYKNEPEVKSSSYRLSFCMLAGLYLILLTSFVHLLSSGLVIQGKGLRVFVCNIEQYLFGIGADLLFATLLFKSARVWRIFTLHGRTSKFWSDNYLMLFIGLVVSVKIAMLIIWTIADAYTLEDVETVVFSSNILSHYMVVQQCNSRQYIVWILLVYCFTIALVLCVVAVSLKTRKIKQENFKDTKKVNVLALSLIYLGLVCGSLWAVLRLTGNSAASKVLIGMTSTLIAVLCEIFLFLPKVLPPLVRQFKVTKCQTGVRHKDETSNSGSITHASTVSTLLSHSIK